MEIEQVVDAGFDWRTGFPLLASLVQASLFSAASCPAKLADASMHLPGCTGFMGAGGKS